MLALVSRIGENMADILKNIQTSVQKKKLDLLFIAAKCKSKILLIGQIQWAIQKI